MPSVKDRISQFAGGAAINSHLSLEDFGSMKTASGRVQNAFLDPQRVMLPARTKLYKFNSYPSLRPDKAGNVTPWWSPFEPYDVDPGWYAKAAMAKVFRISVRELGRVTSAITESWNSCEYLATIVLTVDIWVMYGRFRQMARSDGGASMMITNPKEVPPGFRAEGRGGARAQFTDKAGAKQGGHLPGGGRQFFIPNLKPEYYKGFSAQSLLTM